MDDRKRTRLATEEIVVGYAMSRLHASYYASRGLESWNLAYAEAALALDRPEMTLKNLRDEFDPYHGNPRKGWRGRLLRLDRQRVLDDLRGVSDDALLELVNRILVRDEDSVVEAIDSLARVESVAANVAERLLTGRKG